jgi:cell division septation protein DedD
MRSTRPAGRNRRRFAVPVLLVGLTATAIGTHAGVGALQTDAVAPASQTACVVYWLQIGAFRDVGNATRLVGQATALIAGDGGPALLVAQIDVGGAPLYRVLSGPHDAAFAEQRRLKFQAAGVPVSASTSTVEEPCGAAAPSVTVPPLGPPPTGTPAISAEPPPASVAGVQVQAGSFRSIDYAQRMAAELNAALGTSVVPGEFSVVSVEVGGAPLYRVRSRVHARAEGDALLVLVRTTVPDAALVNV